MITSRDCFAEISIVKLHAISLIGCWDLSARRCSKVLSSTNFHQISISMPTPQYTDLGKWVEQSTFTQSLSYICQITLVLLTLIEGTYYTFSADQFKTFQKRKLLFLSCGLLTSFFIILNLRVHRHSSYALLNTTYSVDFTHSKMRFNFAKFL